MNAQSKKKMSAQMSFNIPFTFRLNLDKPLYYLNERYKFGRLIQLALPLGEYEMTGEEFSKHHHKLSLSDGNKFLAVIERKRGGIYQIKGNVEHLPFERKGDDLKISGSGESGKGLRAAQVGSIYSLLSHWSISKLPATIILPTGTGKTETMLVATLADKAKRTLVIVPSIELKLQIAEKYVAWGILRSLGIITYETLNPKVLVLEKILKDVDFMPIIQVADVVITTPSLIARADRESRELMREMFSHVFFDEAHHIIAPEWTDIKELFKDAKIVQFTATPYRNDKKPVEGKIVYNYPLSMALEDKVFSKISLISVDERHPVKKDRAIADAAIARLLSDRKAGYIKHKMMVRADKKSHAEQLLKNYQEWFPSERVTMVYSGTKGKNKLVEQIRDGKFDIVICVDMLKEGFDFPDFKIAAVHRLHQSLGVLLQFIGRFTRTQDGLGPASFVVNFAEESLSLELENLLQEGDGWETVISEVADKRKAEAESLLHFLQGCVPYMTFDSPDISLNPKIVYPALSCVLFECKNVDWKNFKEVFDLTKYGITRPYLNEKENVFFFTTQKRERVKWAKTNKISDQTWNLVVMHWDKDSKLLYIHHSDKSLDVKTMALNLSGEEAKQFTGDYVFRSFDAIKRLSIVHAGIFKPANHLHRYSRLSGADVTTELSRWKSGGNIKKSDFVGIGFRDGMPESVGASIKGKVWSPARIGDILQWKAWCLKMGALITDETIDANQLLKDSAEKIQLEDFPSQLIVLATDWNEELYAKIHNLSVEGPKVSGIMLSECTLRNTSTKGKTASFVLNILDMEFAFSVTLGGENGHIVEGFDDSKVSIVGLKSDPVPLRKFFEENPPTLFLMDGSTIAGSIQTKFNLAENAVLQIPEDRIKMLLWKEVSFKTESMYKNGVARENSVQEYIMKLMAERGAKIVFNDDNSGESADVVAIFEDEDVVRFELIHCKYSKANIGARLEDLYEVCGQAVVSLRYKWKPEELLKHMDRRNGTGVLKGKRYYLGNSKDTDNIKKAIRYKEAKFEFAIAQPGIDTKSITSDMMNFLGSIYSTVVEMTETSLRCYFS